MRLGSHRPQSLNFCKYFYERRRIDKPYNSVNLDDDNTKIYSDTAKNTIITQNSLL